MLDRKITRGGEIASPGKNVSVEFFRVFFMVLLCLQHFGYNVKTVEHGYYCVEFFFVLSGMLLYRSFLKPSSEGAIRYTLGKIRRFFKKYAIVMCCVLAVGIGYDYLAGKILSWGDYSFDKLLTVFTDLAFIQNVGPWKGGINLPTWYLSVLIFGGGFLYNLLKVNRDWAVKVIFPLLFVGVYTRIFGHADRHDIEVWSVSGEWFYMPLWRGMADMAAGVLLCHFLRNQEERLRTDANYARLFDVLSVAALLLMTVLVFRADAPDQYAVLCSAGILSGCFAPAGIFRRWIKSRVWVFLGGLTFEMLLVHNVISLCLHQANPYLHLPNGMLLTLYFALVFAASYLLKKICE